MTWRQRWRAWWRSKLHEFKVRSKAARAGWRDPQPVLRPFWPVRATDGTYWNRDLLFQQHRDVLAIFIPIDRECGRDMTGVTAAKIANEARGLVRDAVLEWQHAAR